MFSNRLMGTLGGGIAVDLGTDVSAVRIHSLRRVGGEAPVPSRGELVAAISAAIAEDLGTDVSAIRIHSLRRAG